MSASGIKVPFELRDDDGVLQAGVDLSTAGVIQVSQHGAAFVNRAGAAPTSIGGGSYYYELDSTEASEPWVLVKIDKTGYKAYAVREDVDTRLDRLLGLHRENSLLDGGSGFALIQYNGNQLMVAARLRVFASKAATNAATAGAADDADSESERYILTGTDNGSGLLGRFKMVRDL